MQLKAVPVVLHHQILTTGIGPGVDLKNLKCDENTCQMKQIDKVTKEQ